MPSDRRKVVACKRRFKTFYPGGFHDDEDYVALERDYKWNAHRAWVDLLGGQDLSARVREGDYEDLARSIVRIESRTTGPAASGSDSIAGATASTTCLRSFMWVQGSAEYD